MQGASLAGTAEKPLRQTGFLISSAARCKIRYNNIATFTKYSDTPGICVHHSSAMQLRALSAGAQVKENTADSVCCQPPGERFKNSEMHIRSISNYPGLRATHCHASLRIRKKHRINCNRAHFLPAYLCAGPTGSMEQSRCSRHGCLHERDGRKTSIPLQTWQHQKRGKALLDAQ